MGLFDTVRGFLGIKSKEKSTEIAPVDIPLTQEQRNRLSTQAPRAIPQTGSQVTVDVPLTQQQINNFTTQAPRAVEQVSPAVVDVPFTQQQRNQIQAANVPAPFAIPETLQPKAPDPIDLPFTQETVDRLSTPTPFISESHKKQVEEESNQRNIIQQVGDFMTKPVIPAQRDAEKWTETLRDFSDTNHSVADDIFKFIDEGGSLGKGEGFRGVSGHLSDYINPTIAGYVGNIAGGIVASIPRAAGFLFDTAADIKSGDYRSAVFNGGSTIFNAWVGNGLFKGGSKSLLGDSVNFFKGASKNGIINTVKSIPSGLLSVGSQTLKNIFHSPIKSKTAIGTLWNIVKYPVATLPKNIIGEGFGVIGYISPGITRAVGRSVSLDIGSAVNEFFKEGGALDSITKLADSTFMDVQDLVDMGAQNVLGKEKQDIVDPVIAVANQTVFNENTYDKLRSEIVDQLGFNVQGTQEEQLQQFAAISELLKTYRDSNGFSAISNFSADLSSWFTRTSISMGGSAASRVVTNNNEDKDEVKETRTETGTETETETGTINQEKKVANENSDYIKTVDVVGSTTDILKKGLGEKRDSSVSSLDGTRVINNALATERNMQLEQNQLKTMIVSIIDAVDSDPEMTVGEHRIIAGDVQGAIDVFNRRTEVNKEMFSYRALYELQGDSPKVAQQKAIVKAAGLDVNNYAKNYKKATDIIQQQITINGRKPLAVMNELQSQVADSNALVVDGGFQWIQENVDSMVESLYPGQPVDNLGLQTIQYDPLGTQSGRVGDSLKSFGGELTAIASKFLIGRMLTKSTNTKLVQNKIIRGRGALNEALDEFLDVNVEAALGAEVVTTEEVGISFLVAGLAGEATDITARQIRDPNETLPTIEQFASETIGGTPEEVGESLAISFINNQKKALDDLARAEASINAETTTEVANDQEIQKVIDETISKTAVEADKAVEKIDPEKQKTEKEVNAIVLSNKSIGEKVRLLQTQVQPLVNALSSYVNAAYTQMIDTVSDFGVTQQGETDKLNVIKSALAFKTNQKLKILNAMNVSPTVKKSISNKAIAGFRTTVDAINKTEKNLLKKNPDRVVSANEIIDTSKALPKVVRSGHHSPIKITEGQINENKDSDVPKAVQINALAGAKIADSIQESANHKYDKKVNHKPLMDLNAAVMQSSNYQYKKKDLKAWQSLYNLMKGLPYKQANKISAAVQRGLAFHEDPMMVVKSLGYAHIGSLFDVGGLDSGYEVLSDIDKVNAEINNRDMKAIAEIVALGFSDKQLNSDLIKEFDAKNKYDIDQKTKQVTHLSLMDKSTEDKEITKEIKSNIESSLIFEIQNKREQLDILESLSPVLSAENTDLNEIKKNIHKISEKDYDTAITMLLGEVPSINTQYLLNPDVTYDLISKNISKLSGKARSKALNNRRKVLVGEALMRVKNEGIVNDTALAYVMIRLGVDQNMKFMSGGFLQDIIVHNTASRYVQYFKSQKLKSAKGNSVDIKRGDIIFVVGPHRSGKSTFLSSLEGSPKYTVIDGDSFVSDQYNTKKLASNSQLVRNGVKKSLSQWNKKDIAVVSGRGFTNNIESYLSYLKSNGFKNNVYIVPMKRSEKFDPNVDKIGEEGLKNQQLKMKRFIEDINRGIIKRNGFALSIINKDLASAQSSTIIKDFVSTFNEYAGSELLASSRTQKEAESFSQGKVFVNPEFIDLTAPITDYPLVGLQIIKAKNKFAYTNIISQFTATTKASQEIAALTKEISHYADVKDPSKITSRDVSVAMRSRYKENILPLLEKLEEVSIQVEKDFSTKIKKWTTKKDRAGKFVFEKLSELGLHNGDNTMYSLMNQYALFQTYVDPVNSFVEFTKRESITKKAKLIGIDTSTVAKDSLFTKIANDINERSGKMGGVEQRIALSIAEDLQNGVLYNKIKQSPVKTERIVKSTLEYLQRLDLLSIYDSDWLVLNDKKRIVFLTANPNISGINTLNSQINLPAADDPSYPISIYPGKKNMNLEDEFTLEDIADTVFISVDNANAINGAVYELNKGFGIISDGSRSLKFSNRSKAAIKDLQSRGLDGTYNSLMYALETGDMDAQKRRSISQLQEDYNLEMVEMNRVLQKTNTLNQSIGKLSGGGDKVKSDLSEEVDMQVVKGNDLIFERYVLGLTRYLYDLGYKASQSPSDTTQNLKKLFSSEEMVDGLFADTPQGLTSNALHILHKVGYRFTGPEANRDITSTVLTLANDLVSKGMTEVQDLVRDLSVIYPLLLPENRAVWEKLNEFRTASDGADYQIFRQQLTYTYTDANGNEVEGNAVNALRNIVLSMKDSGSFTNDQGQINFYIAESSLERLDVDGDTGEVNEGRGSRSFQNTTRDQVVLLLNYLAKKFDDISVDINSSPLFSDSKDPYFNVTALQHVTGNGKLRPKADSKKNDVAGNKKQALAVLQEFWNDQYRHIESMEKKFSVKMPIARAELAEKMNLIFRDMTAGRAGPKIRTETTRAEGNAAIKIVVDDRSSNLESLDGKTITMFDKFKSKVLPIVGLHNTLKIAHLTKPSLGIVDGDNMFLRLLGIDGGSVQDIMDNQQVQEKRIETEKIMLDATQGGSEHYILNRQTVEAGMYMQAIQEVRDYAVGSYIDLTGITSEVSRGLSEASVFGRVSFGFDSKKTPENVFGALIKTIDRLGEDGKTSEEIIAEIKKDGKFNTMIQRFGIALPAKTEGSAKFLKQLKKDANDTQKMFKGMVTGLLRLRNDVQKGISKGLYPNRGTFDFGDPQSPEGLDTSPQQEAQNLVDNINLFFNQDVLGAAIAGHVQADQVVKGSQSFEEFAEKTVEIITKEAGSYLSKVAEAETEGGSALDVYAPTESVFQKTLLEFSDYKNSFTDKNGSTDYEALASKFFEINAAKAVTRDLTVGDIVSAVKGFNMINLSEFIFLGESLGIVTGSTRQKIIDNIESIDELQEIDFENKIGASLNTLSNDSYNSFVGTLSNYYNSKLQYNGHIKELKEKIKQAKEKLDETIFSISKLEGGQKELLVQERENQYREVQQLKKDLSAAIKFKKKMDAAYTEDLVVIDDAEIVQGFTLDERQEGISFAEETLKGLLSKARNLINSPEVIAYNEKVKKGISQYQGSGLFKIVKLFVEGPNGEQEFSKLLIPFNERKKEVSKFKKQMKSTIVKINSLKDSLIKSIEKDTVTSKKIEKFRKDRLVLLNKMKDGIAEVRQVKKIKAPINLAGEIIPTGKEVSAVVGGNLLEQMISEIDKISLVTDASNTQKLKKSIKKMEDSLKSIEEKISEVETESNEIDKKLKGLEQFEMKGKEKDVINKLLEIDKQIKKAKDTLAKRSGSGQSIQQRKELYYDC